MRLQIVDKRITLGLVAIAVLAAILVSGCIQQGGYKAQTGILIGTVLAGPTCPVETSKYGESDPHCLPVPVSGAELLLQTSDGKQTLKLFRTDEKGRFEVEVPPGTYRIHPRYRENYPRSLGASQSSSIAQTAGVPAVVNWSTLPQEPPKFLPGTTPPSAPSVENPNRLGYPKTQPSVSPANASYKEEQDTSAGKPLVKPISGLQPLQNDKQVVYHGNGDLIVKVLEGQTTNVNIWYDTGIR